jgi:hypothetical protein
MNASLLLGWAGTFLLTLLVLLKLNHRRETKRRVSRGLRAYTTGVPLA